MNLKSALLPFVLSLLFLACETESYESGDMRYSNLRADFAEAYSGGAGTLVSFTTDDGDSLVIDGSYESSWAATADSVYRALVYYSKAAQGHAAVVAVASVPVPQLVPAYTLDTIKNDPLTLASAWKSRSGRYVTLGIDILTGTTDGELLQQQVGVVCDTLVVHDNGRKHLHLQLYHDQNGVPEYYTSHHYVSIPLNKSPYQLGTGDTMTVRVNTYDGWVSRQFVY